MKTSFAKVMIIAAAGLLASGCATVRAHKGAVLDPQLVNSIQAGVDNKASVEKVLGRPSFTGQFAPNDWYYIARDTSQLVFRNPRVKRQIVLLVRFDQAGNVAKIEHSGKEVVLALDPASRKTPTLGRKRGFFEELFGNIGTVGSVSTQQ
ncbi:MAG: outer membrane protein assembly factor BamE [Sphingomicrobium sp.]